MGCEWFSAMAARTDPEYLELMGKAKALPYWIDAMEVSPVRRPRLYWVSCMWKDMTISSGTIW